MSECVVRMEMPEGCWDCPCVNGEYGYCQADKEERQIEDPNERPSWCPIIAVSPWHRVEDELPDDGEWAIFTNGKVVTVERFKLDAYNHFFPASEWFDFDDAIAWMPLPEPPKEDA